jgi:acyl-CoA thioester hydrolase
MTDAFVHPLSVRYLEVDAQGVVFNMWYLGWIDDALTAFLAHNGLDYAQMMAAGYDVQLVHASLDWREGLRWGDEAAVAVRLAKVGTTSFSLAFTFLRAGDPVAAAQVVYVCVAVDGSGKRPLPALVLAGLGRSD